MGTHKAKSWEKHIPSRALKHEEQGGLAGLNQRHATQQRPELGEATKEGWQDHGWTGHYVKTVDLHPKEQWQPTIEFKYGE